MINITKQIYLNIFFSLIYRMVYKSYKRRCWIVDSIH